MAYFEDSTDNTNSHKKKNFIYMKCAMHDIAKEKEFK